ncbi:hypothetical protein HK405_008942, partial [Cladochytrium tenue]
MDDDGGTRRRRAGDGRGDVGASAASARTAADLRNLLKFYNMRSLDADRWGDDRAPPQGGMRPRSVIAPAGAEERTGDAAAALDAVVAAAESVDLSDPLGIKTSILGQVIWRAGVPIRLLPDRNTADLPTQESIEKLLISSKNYDPKAFLRVVHGKTSSRDVENGAKHLAVVIDKNRETMKAMVKQHFAKFVSAKGAIDSFYLDMRSNSLVKSDTKGLDAFERSVEELIDSAQSLYGPMLERRDRAEKIRSALSILEQWKFFFNLPSTLEAAIKKVHFDALKFTHVRGYFQGRYDVAVRDYNKGKYLMTSSFADGKDPLAPPDASKESSSAAADALLSTRHRKVFEQVWQEVDKIVAGFREGLFKQLESRSLDSAEQGARIKRRADVKKMTKCSVMIKHIVDLYQAHISQIFFIEEPLDAAVRASRDDIQSSSASPETDTRNLAGASAKGRPLPAHFSSFLHAHPLTECHWAAKVMGELVRCFEDVRHMRVGGGTTIEENVLKSVGGAADAVKRKCVEAICDAVLSESRKFFEYEDWTFESQRGHDGEQPADQDSSEADTTHHMRLFYRFEKFVLRSLQKIASAP